MRSIWKILTPSEWAPIIERDHAEALLANAEHDFWANRLRSMVALQRSHDAAWMQWRGN